MQNEFQKFWQENIAVKTKKDLGDGAGGRYFLDSRVKPGKKQKMGIGAAGPVPNSELARQDLAGRKRKGGSGSADRPSTDPSQDNTSARVRGPKDVNTFGKEGGHYDTYEGGPQGRVDSHEQPHRTFDASQKTPPIAPRKSPLNKNTDHDKLVSAAKERANRYQVEFKEGKGHLTKPEDYTHLKDEQFADPVNYKYPIDEPHIRAARSYFAQDEHRTQGGYTEEEWKKIGARIDEAAKKFKIGEYAEKTMTQEIAKGLDLSVAFPEQGGAPFRIMIEKATVNDGLPIGQMPERLIVEGLASTTNVDHDKERMSPEALQAMVDKVNSSGVPLMSEHRKGWDDHLGNVVKAWLDDRGQMHIQAELNPDMSTAVDLYKALKKGAQLGLSIAGIVKRAGLEMVEALGNRVKTFYDVLLKEVSVTATPSNFDTWLVAKGRQKEPGLYEKYVGTETYREYIKETPLLDWQLSIAKSVPDNLLVRGEHYMTEIKKDSREGQETGDETTGGERETATAEETTASSSDQAPTPKSAESVKHSDYSTGPRSAPGSGTESGQGEYGPETVSDPKAKPDKKTKSMPKTYSEEQFKSALAKGIEVAMKAMDSSSESESSDSSEDAKKHDEYSSGVRSAPGAGTETTEGEYGPDTVSDPEKMPAKKKFPAKKESASSEDTSDEDMDSEDSSSTEKAFKDSVEAKALVGKVVEQVVKNMAQKGQRVVSVRHLTALIEKSMQEPMGRKGIASAKAYAMDKGYTEKSEATSEASETTIEKDAKDANVSFGSFFKKHLASIPDEK